MKYPGTRWVIARSRLGILKITTINTFKDLIKSWGLEEYVDYHLFNNNIQFKNGSEVLLMDLFLFPADPDFNKLGSLEITGALIDEGAEIDERAFTILTSRIRYKLKENNLIPKLLIVSNPTRNWIYRNFYKLERDGLLPEYRKFVRSLADDNPFLPREYITNLQRLPDIDRKRLYEGQWEFATTDYDLFDMGKLYDMFDVDSKRGHKYITCDVASTGNDSTVIILWDGYTCLSIKQYKNIDTVEIISKIRDMMDRERIKKSNVIVDAIGVGVGVADGLRCRRFIAGSKPFKGEQFNHLKSQLFFKFADLVNQGLIGIRYEKDRDSIIDELSFHKRYNADSDGKWQVTPKDKVKRDIGRSPDIADALMMRTYFEFQGEMSFSFL